MLCKYLKEIQKEITTKNNNEIDRKIIVNAFITTNISGVKNNYLYLTII